MPEPVDWCQRARDLRKKLDDLAAGENATQIRFGDDWWKGSKGDISQLKLDLAEAERNCAIEGGETPKRRRYAQGARVTRPY